MGNELKQELSNLSVLSLDEIDNVITELSMMLGIDFPKRSIGMNKNEYLDVIIKIIEDKQSELASGNIFQKHAEIMQYAEKKSPGIWKQVEAFGKKKEPGLWTKFIISLKNFKMFSLTNRKN